MVKFSLATTRMRLRLYHTPNQKRILERRKLEDAGNEGHKQAGKADRAFVPLRYFPLPI